MIVHHTFTIRSMCPVNGDADEYRCTVTLGQIVTCESLLDEAKRYEGVALYQEELTAKLAETWQATVRTIGKHVGGVVETECIAFPKSLVSLNSHGEHK